MKARAKELQYANEALAIVEQFEFQFVSKYVAGGREHGGNFNLKPTVKEVRAEVLDLVAYTHSLEEHHQQLIAKAYAMVVKHSRNKEVMKDFETLHNLIVDL